MPSTSTFSTDEACSLNCTMATFSATLSMVPPPPETGLAAPADSVSEPDEVMLM